MTGYGHVNTTEDGLEITVDIRSLNSKFLDLNLKLPRRLNHLEATMRQKIGEKLVRGKVSIQIDLVSMENTPTQDYNQQLFNHYYRELQKLADGVFATKEELFKLAIQSPDVVVNREEANKPNDTADDLAIRALEKALDACDSFRSSEGEALHSKLAGYVANIEKGLEQVELLDPKRVERIKERVSENVRGVVGTDNMDENRFEQELIYYMEKLDLSEEKVRLKNHCEFFVENMNAPVSHGKKLGFISQEIGREINTIGSKANDADIQRIVVSMKDELEKIKEQVLNVL